MSNRSEADTPSEQVQSHTKTTSQIAKPSGLLKPPKTLKKPTGIASVHAKSTSKLKTLKPPSMAKKDSEGN